MDLLSMMAGLKGFGFPIIIAIWALWRLDKSWTKGEGIQSSLDHTENAIDRIEIAINKQADIQHEMLTTLKILHTVIVSGNGGGER